MNTRHSHAAFLATAAVLLLGACSSPTHGMPSMTAMPSMPAMTAMSSAPSSQVAPVAGNAVAIDNFAFDPPSVSVPVGTTVTWTNRDEEPHNIAANDGSFHSLGLGAQATYSYTFRTPGTFDYICGIHPFMHGTVVVTG